MNRDDKSTNHSMKYGWLWAIAITGALMLLTGLFWMRFDLVIQSQGVVEAKSTYRVYAPREAWVREILTEPGREVEVGEVLLRLRDEALDREILATEESLLDVRLEISLAENRREELMLTGGGLEALTAAASLELHAERLKLLKELNGIYEALAERGSVSRVERLSVETQWLNARRDAMRDEVLVGLQEEGVPELLLRREQALETAARERLRLLERRLEALSAERERLTVRAPMGGRVTNLHARETGMAVERGQVLLTVADPEEGYVARMYVRDRNVDLLLPGLPVRMDSHVFASSAEGYMHGEVLQVVTDVDSSETDGFEVLVSIDRWPVTPVLGSRVNAEVLLRRQGLGSLLLPRSLRDPQNVPEKKGGTHGP